jgi:hypothetical protein
MLENADDIPAEYTLMETRPLSGTRIMTLGDEGERATS